MKPADVKPSMYIDLNKKNNTEGPKFKVGDHVRISKYKNILHYVAFQIGLKNILWLKKVKNTLLWTYVIIDIYREEIVGTFYKKELKKKSKRV